MKKNRTDSFQHPEQGAAVNQMLSNTPGCNMKDASRIRKISLFFISAYSGCA
ncbi:hypothetical protein [Ileibacterium valens]|uniref:hypothetical protein n=1 Tax=Ileibacterium valens TaxID=1862668 RepID=UPI002572C80F|nr:hypothetical protein [Ileibacterium valens]